MCAAFLNESRTRGRIQCSVPEIRAGPLFSVADSKLPPPDPGGDKARVLTDSLKSIPVLIDHRGGSNNESRGCVSEGAFILPRAQRSTPSRGERDDLSGSVVSLTEH